MSGDYRNHVEIICECGCVEAAHLPFQGDRPCVGLRECTEESLGFQVTVCPCIRFVAAHVENTSAVQAAEQRLV